MRNPLSKIGRMVLSALIVIEVHARDVVHKMVDLNVQVGGNSLAGRQIKTILEKYWFKK